MSKGQLWPPLLVFALVLTVYLATMAPGLTWEHRGGDGGDFLAAAATLGVPHPAGYPTYTLLLRLFMALPFREPAAAGNFLSALMGAAAAALCWALIQELLAPLARNQEERPYVPWVALLGALAFAWTPLVWGQALITEVYTFHLVLVSAALWLLLRWRRTGRGLAWAAWVTGLGMTNHLTTVFLGPAALALLLAHYHKVRWRPLLAAGGALLLGLAPYAYIPWAARRMPPVNWENAQTWEGFRRLVLALRYSHNLLEPTPAEVLARLSSWTEALPPLILAPLALLLFWGWVWLLRRDLPAGVMTGVYALLSAGYAAGYGTSDYWVNLLPAVLVLAVWLAVGLWALLGWLPARPWRHAQRARRLLMGAALLLPLLLLGRFWPEMDLGRPGVAQDFVDRVLAQAEPGALVLTKGDHGTFGMWYACYVRDQRPDIVPVLPTFLQRTWYRETLQANHAGLDLRPEQLTGSGALQTMIERHLDRRPVYLTWEDAATAERYPLSEEWPLWRVMPPTPLELP